MLVLLFNSNIALLMISFLGKCNSPVVDLTKYTRVKRNAEYETPTKQYTFFVGTKVALPCISGSSDGITGTKFNWEHYYMQPIKNPRYQIMNDGSLVINEVQVKDTGHFTCEATGQSYRDRMQHKLEIIAVPSTKMVAVVDFPIIECNRKDQDELEDIVAEKLKNGFCEKPSCDVRKVISTCQIDPSNNRVMYRTEIHLAFSKNPTNNCDYICTKQKISTKSRQSRDLIKRLKVRNAAKAYFEGILRTENETESCLEGMEMKKSVCVPCHPGRFERNGVCELCPEDTYQKHFASNQCDPCPDGESTREIGATSLGGCFVRKGGYYAIWFVISVIPITVAGLSVALLFRCVQFRMNKVKDLSPTIRHFMCLPQSYERRNPGPPSRNSKPRASSKKSKPMYFKVPVISPSPPPVINLGEGISSSESDSYQHSSKSPDLSSTSSNRTTHKFRSYEDLLKIGEGDINRHLKSPCFTPSIPPTPVFSPTMNEQRVMMSFDGQAPFLPPGFDNPPGEPANSLPEKPKSSNFRKLELRQKTFCRSGPAESYSMTPRSLEKPFSRSQSDGEKLKTEPREFQRRIFVSKIPTVNKNVPFSEHSKLPTYSYQATDDLKAQVLPQAYHTSSLTKNNGSPLLPEDNLVSRHNLKLPSRHQSYLSNSAIPQYSNINRYKQRLSTLSKANPFSNRPLFPSKQNIYHDQYSPYEADYSSLITSSNNKYISSISSTSQNHPNAETSTRPWLDGETNTSSLSARRRIPLDPVKPLRYDKPSYWNTRPIHLGKDTSPDSRSSNQTGHSSSYHSSKAMSEEQKVSGSSIVTAESKVKKAQRAGNKATPKTKKDSSKSTRNQADNQARETFSSQNIHRKDVEQVVDIQAAPLKFHQKKPKKVTQQVPEQDHSKHLQKSSPSPSPERLITSRNSPPPPPPLPPMSGGLNSPDRESYLSSARSVSPTAMREKVMRQLNPQLAANFESVALELKDALARRDREDNSLARLSRNDNSSSERAFFDPMLIPSPVLTS